MSENKAMRSPLGLRLFILFGSVLLALLIVWMLNYLTNDLDRIRPVDWEKTRRAFVSVEKDQQKQQLVREIHVLDQEISVADSQRQHLSESVKTLRTTMEQVIALQMAGVEQKLPVSAEQQKAVEEAQTKFFRSQDEYQKQLERIQALRDDKAQREMAKSELEQEIGGGEAKAHAEYGRLQQHRLFLIGLLKIAILLPLVALASWLFFRYRATPYSPMAWAVGGAVLYELIVIIHAHFPSRLSRYVFLLTAILVVIRLLITSIRSSVKPALQTLLRRYREAYRKVECPVCGFPMTAGLSPFALISRQLSTRRFVLSGSVEVNTERPYACPSCGQMLFEKCGECGQVRHSLLPACGHCGAKRDITAPTASSGA